AKLNVLRCRILAPYNGRVVQKNADVGQFVGNGTTLGTIYSTEIFEVRLPLRDDQLAFLDLEAEEKAEVLLKGERGDEDVWAARIERSAASVDAATRQLFVIAAIDTQVEGAPPLPSGTFVEAEIAGKVLSDVFVIPRKAIRGGDSVLWVREDKTVRVMPLDIVYDGDSDVVVAKTEGRLQPGSRISITPLPFVNNGDQITIKGEDAPTGAGGDVAGMPKGKGKGKGGKGKGKGGPPSAAGS
ncbi:MAG: HlyD family efflux transporter periplasmic adaptor subunit, partial [Verrucomicrobiota bacterium]